MNTAAAAKSSQGRYSPSLVGRSELSELARAACEPNPFYHPAILLPAIEHLDVTNSVRMIEVREAGQMIALMPLAVRERHGRYPVRNTANWVYSQCFFGAPLLRTGSETQSWARILQHLDAADWSGNFLHLEGFALDGPVAAALQDCCAQTGRNLKIITQHQRAMLMSDLSAHSYWQTHVRAKKRKEVKRLSRRLEDMGNVTRHRLTHPSDAMDWAQDFLILEASGWKGKQGTALNSNERSRVFFLQALSDAASCGMLDMLRIDLDGEAIAMLINFRMGSASYSYKIAFDERFARFSPGVLIEIDNLHAALSDPELDWMDSCAVSDHPMIDGIWAERRTIVQFRVELKGHGLLGLKRRAAFAATGVTEQAISMLKRPS